MKNKKQIEAKLKKFDKIETFHYGGPSPINEWLMHQDLGWRAALRWILEIDEKEILKRTST